MKFQKLFNGVYKIKRHSLLLVCAVALMLTASVASGALTVIANVCSMFFAGAPAPTSPPVLLEYPLQTSPPYTVAIDPGHGNFDIGAKGIIKELEVIESTTDKLFALLKADVNYNPVLTRSKDEDIKSGERAKRATDAKASLFISIHANADHSSGQSYGFECYPTPPGRTYSDESMQFARRIVAKMAEKGQRIRGENGIKFAYYNGKSKKMVDSSNTKVRTQKSFGVVEKPLCPSVLVEQCFITSRKDIAAWASEEGCQKAAEAYYEAICEYFGTEAATH